MRRGLATVAVFGLATVVVASAAALRPGPLAPGRHATSKFTPRLSFAVGNGWAVAEEVPERADSFLLRPLPPSVRSMSFFRVTRVYGPRANERSRPVRAPANVARMVANHPALHATRPARTRIGGRPATWVDAGVRPEIRAPYQRCASLRRCVYLFHTANGPVYLFGGKRVRFYFIRAAGATVAITIESLTTDFDAFVRVATPVVRSVRFVRR